MEQQKTSEGCLGSLAALAATIGCLILVIAISSSIFFTRNEEINGSDPSAQGGHDGIDRLLRNMEFGAIAFNAPITINVEESQHVQLVLSLNETVDELKAAIEEEGERLGAIVKVSDRMEARLSGFMFQITAITPEEQAVSARERTEWKWEVHPKQEGQHNLHLTLTALLDIDGHGTRRAIRTFEKTISVEITASQRAERFLFQNWQWLWAAILVPIAGWLWSRRKKPPRVTTS